MRIVQDSKLPQNVVAVIPAAGRASRLAPLFCSKELYPIGFQSINNGSDIRPKVICQYLLEKLEFAGIHKAFVVLREGKWDIPAYLGAGSLVGMDLAYLMVTVPYGVPFTVDQARSFVQNSIVAFGFPDIVFKPDDAFRQLLAKQAATEADMVLGVYPADQPHRMDVVNIDAIGRIRQIVVKPQSSDLHYAWSIAVWTPRFTSFLHEYLLSEIDRFRGAKTSSDRPELFLGEVIQAAIDEGLQVESVLFPDHFFLDIGTPENLLKAVRTFTPGLEFVQ